MSDNSYPPGATPINAFTGIASATPQTATLTIPAGKVGYVAGLAIEGLGATAASMVTITITGLSGGTLSIPFGVPTGAGTTGYSDNYAFPQPLPGIVSTNIVLNLPSFGAGNVGQGGSIWGYYL